MKKILAIALVGLMAASANAAMLSFVDMTPGAHFGSLSPEGDPMTLGVSEEGVIGVVLELWADPVSPSFGEYVAGVNIYLDSVQMAPVAEAMGLSHGEIYPGAENFEVIDVTVDTDAEFVWTGSRAYTVDPMPLFQPPAALPLAHGSGISLDEYYLVANMAAGEYLVGDPAVGRQFVIDQITIHGTSVSTDTVWFENQWTFQPAFAGGTLRQQAVFNQALTQLGIADTTGPASGGKLGFYNGFIKTGKAGILWETPGYWVNVVPEPASLALLALGGLALLRRRS